MCFSKTVLPTLFDNLGRPLDLPNLDHTLWSDKCDYIGLNKVNNFNKNNKNIIILQLNIRSLLGKQSNLNMLLNKLYNQNSLPKIILLSETHLNNSKLRHINIPKYKILSRNQSKKWRSCSNTSPQYATHKRKK